MARWEPREVTTILSKACVFVEFPSPHSIIWVFSCCAIYKRWFKLFPRGTRTCVWSENGQSPQTGCKAWYTLCKVRHTGVYHLHGFNPFTAPACKISRLKDARRRLQTVYSGPVTQPSVLCDLGWKSFYMPMRKRLQGFRFQTLIGRFHVTSWRWRDESFDCLNGVYCLQGAIPDSLLFAGHEHHWELGSCWFHHLPERLSEHNMWPAPHRCIAQCTSGNMG